ncbi:MAG: ATPase domain-containing protein, partial [Candidatus Desantisbacteria bacterium]
SIFFHYQDPAVIRRELYRIISRLKKMNITCLITVEREAEKDKNSMFGVEQFVSDNIILLHNRLNENGKRDRSIEILKFRGSAHDSQEVPLLIDRHGVKIYPLVRPELKAKMSDQKVSIGIKGLDEMLYGGIYQNSITLITGASGTGKTVAGLHFLMEGARRGENTLMLEFEESPDQLCTNASSFGWELKKYVDEGSIQLLCQYDESLRAEQYLDLIRCMVVKHQIKRFVMDPVSSLQRIYSDDKFWEFVTILTDFLRIQNITALFTSISHQILGGAELSEIKVSTTVDNIIILKYVELGGRIRRLVNVLKQRGSRHMKELMEFDITSKGLEVLGTFARVENLISGSARRVRIRFDEEDAEKEFMEEAKRGRV